MMTLILGGSGSGKSAWAEAYTERICRGEQKYYIATMQVYGEEGQKKVEKHRQQRSGKGFLTVEQPVDLARAAEKMAEGEKTALLECLSNLTANEMFRTETPETEAAVTEKILADVAALHKTLRHLVIVSNNVFEDGSVYDETTMAYIRALGRINTALAQTADTVTEVVVGIPVVCVPDRRSECE